MFLKQKMLLLPDFVESLVLEEDMHSSYTMKLEIV